jgi:hypothetical protein
MSAHGRIIEIRWAAQDDFEEIDVICGTFDDAVNVCVKFGKTKKMRHLDHLTWIEGAADTNGPVYYAHAYAATFRIRE